MVGSKAIEILVRADRSLYPAAFAEHSVFVGRLGCYD